MNAQLGQQPNINLGGYIPAAARQPKIWQQVLAGFLGNMANQAGGAVVDRVTAPDLNQLDAATGKMGEQPWYRRNPNAAEITAVRGAEQSGVRTENDSKRVGLEKIRAENDEAATTRRLDQGDRSIALQEGSQRTDAFKTYSQIKQVQDELVLAKAKFAQTQKVEDRNYAMAVERQLAEILDTKFNQDYKKANLSLQSKKLNDEISKTPAEIKALEASAVSKSAYGNLANEKAMTAEEMRAALQRFVRQSK